MARQSLCYSMMSSILAPILLGMIEHTGVGQAQQNPGPPLGYSAPSMVEVEKAISLSAGYLIRACGSDGKFNYKVGIASGHQSSEYDIIRHEGAIYALAVYNGYHQDRDAVDAMVRATGFLRQNYMSAGPSPGQEVIWSKPTSTRSGLKGRSADLGAIGLGLVALVETRRVEPTAVSLKDIRALGRFLLSLEKPDGSLIHRYYEDGDAVTNWTSLYYAGEAALGLIDLYQEDHSVGWLKAAGAILSHLAEARAPFSTAPADHWALIATAKLWPFCETEACGVSQQTLVNQAVLICKSIIHEQIKDSGSPVTNGAFDADGRIAPTATRAEGLLSALTFLPQCDVKFAAQVSARDAIKFLLVQQVTSGPRAGGMPGASRIGATSFAEIRIDFVQHSLCAWVAYYHSIAHLRAAPSK